ncbi:hypothetical protein BLNAU_7248 [Blattamonas nauphoetae]|uniref:Uncharacterized protein n=1 Tax=Blattamonas nauphoetae TaxID=2049346 RepID=A0ABQ9Y284_9EUKA|nr:hypothetical protein BLNAU_7248 [Blattamonas nauphoetae]
MGNKPSRSTTSSGASLNHSRESNSTVDTLPEPFLYFDPNSDLSSPQIQSRLVESDLITKVFATVQPHTLSITGNETMFNKLVSAVFYCLRLADSRYLRELGITDAVDAFNHRKMIFQKVVIPSSQFVTFLISNRYSLKDGSLNYFMSLLDKFIQICPFHDPTLEFVLASPIAMTFSSSLSFVEEDGDLWNFLTKIHDSLLIWKKEGPEVAQSGKRMLQALISEGSEDSLEQKMKHEESGENGRDVVQACHVISKLLGSNVEFTEE